MKKKIYDFFLEFQKKIRRISFIQKFFWILSKAVGGAEGTPSKCQLENFS